MGHTYRTFTPTILTGLAAAALLTSGCQYLPMHKPAAAKKTVVTPRADRAADTMVRVYNLKGIGMEHASNEEIEAFTGIIYDLVVSTDWDKTRSDVQVFGTLMTVKTTPDNHLRIEDYLNRVERAMAAKG